MFEISLAALIGYLMLVEICVLFQRQLNLKSALLGFVYLLVLTGLAAANYELDIIPQKFASNFAFDLFNGQESARDNSTFWLQAIYCFPAFVITNSWLAAIGMNVALMAAMFYFIHSRSPTHSVLMLVPAIINFSMFSLRDPLIAVVAFAVTWLVLYPPKTMTSVSQYGVIGLFALIRPENLAVFGYAKIVTVLNKHNRSFLLYLSFPVIIALSLGIAAYSPKLLGLDQTASVAEIPDVAEEFYESRSNRHVTVDGGGSNILGGRLPSMPLFVRYPIQVFTFFVLPLPFEIRGLSTLLAFVDSVVFIWIYFKFHRTATRDALILFWIYGY